MCIFNPIDFGVLMPHSITTAFTKTRAWLNALDPRIQTAITLLFVAGTLPAVIQTTKNVQQGLDALCGPTRAGWERNLYECYSHWANSKAQEKAEDEFFRNAALTRQAALEKRQRQINDAPTRTRLAESQWGKPYHGPLTFSFVDHSILKMPLCPSGEWPDFFVRYTQPPPGLGIEVEAIDGYWLFDLYQKTAEGKVYTRPPVAATATLQCQSQSTPKPAH